MPSLVSTLKVLYRFIWVSLVKVLDLVQAFVKFLEWIAGRDGLDFLNSETFSIFVNI
jgi:hypothetical protein